MKLRLRVLAPKGMVVAKDLVDRLREILTIIEVGFTITEEALCKTPIIEVMDTDDAEGEFVIRILQRSGYDIEVTD